MYGQYSTMELTFLAKINDLEIPIDSIRILNNTQGDDTTIYHPDNLLVIDYLSDVNENKFDHSDNKFVIKSYSNPATGRINLVLKLSEPSRVEITLSDILGCQAFRYKSNLKRGNNIFSIQSGIKGYNIINFRNSEVSETIKIVNFATGEHCSIDHMYHEDKSHRKFGNIDNGFSFIYGDELIYTAYSDILEASETDNPTGDKAIDFQYSTGKTCTGIPVVYDIEGNSYSTVQIGDQCWMAENLKTTKYRNNNPIPNIINDTNWESLETGSYVLYDNDMSWKDIYGVLYNWYAVIDENGLCPERWHIPIEEEFKILTDLAGGLDSPSGNLLKSSKQVDSPLGGESETDIHPRWDYDVTNYGINTFGLQVPAGIRGDAVHYLSIGSLGSWWTSTEHPGPNHAYYRSLHSSEGYISWYGGDTHWEFSTLQQRLI